MSENRDKFCRRCQQTKPLDDFNNNSAMPDGKQAYCRDCSKGCWSYRRYRGLPKTAICKNCGLTKPIPEFPRTKDGKIKEYKCRDCLTIYNREYQRMRLKYGEYRDTLPGITSFTQLESVIRTLAEFQYVIDKETSRRDRAIAALRENWTDTLEKLWCHKIGLEVMLTTFLKNKTKNKTFSRYFAFGSVRFCNSKLTIELNTEEAEKRIEKP